MMGWWPCSDPFSPEDRCGFGPHDTAQRDPAGEGQDHGDSNQADKGDLPGDVEGFECGVSGEPKNEQNGPYDTQSVTDRAHKGGLRHHHLADLEIGHTNRF